MDRIASCMDGVRAIAVDTLRDDEADRDICALVVFEFDTTADGEYTPALDAALDVLREHGLALEHECSGFDSVSYRIMGLC